MKSLNRSAFHFQRLISVSAVAALLIVLAPTFQSRASAHPGGTDSDGCHVCQTNCPAWGEVSSVRHCDHPRTSDGGSLDYFAPSFNPSLIPPSPNLLPTPTLPNFGSSPSWSRDLPRSSPILDPQVPVTFESLTPLGRTQVLPDNSTKSLDAVSLSIMGAGLFSLLAVVAYVTHLNRKLGKRFGADPSRNGEDKQ